MLLVLELIILFLRIIIIKKRNLISGYLRSCLTKGLDDTTITTEAKYPINFTELGRRICVKSTL